MKLPIATPSIFAAIVCATPASAQDASPFSFLDDTEQQASVFYSGDVSRPDTPQWDVAFTPDGLTVFYSTDAPRQIVMHRWSVEGWSPPVPALAMDGIVHGGVSVSPDGRYLYFSASAEGEKRDLYRLDLVDTSASPQRLTMTPAYGEISVSLASDGTGFMWTDAKRDGSSGIGFYSVRIEGDALEIVSDWSDLQTGDSSGENSPYIDPLARFIIFANYDIAPATSEDLFLSELRDGIPLPPVSLGSWVNSTASDSNPTISPDGRFLLFASNRGNTETSVGDYQLYAIPTSAVPVLNAALQADIPTAALNLTPPVGPIVTSDQITIRDGIDYLGEDSTPFTGTVEDRYPSGAMQRRKQPVKRPRLNA